MNQDLKVMLILCVLVLSSMIVNIITTDSIPKKLSALIFYVSVLGLVGMSIMYIWNYL